VCQNASELEEVANACGWFGWTEGPKLADQLIFQCRCDERHTAIVSQYADDPDYYAEQCRQIRECQTPP
jgi:hypothetical protein